MDNEYGGSSPSKRELEQQAGTAPVDPEHSRYRLAKYIIFGYMLLIIFSFSMPFVVYKIIGFPQNVDPADKIVQVLNAYVGALTGLTGLVGFIIGYYFKEHSEGNK